MEGYLYKWTNFVKGWKPIYLVLDNENSLLFYSNHKDDINKQTISLKSVTIVNEKKKKNFHIDTRNKKIYFRTQTEDEKQAWIDEFAKNSEMLLTSKQNRNNSQTDLPNLSILNQDNLNKTMTITTTNLNMTVIDNSNNKMNGFLENNEEKKQKQMLQRFSNHFNFYHNEIKSKKDVKKSSGDDKFDDIIQNFQHLQNLYFEFNIIIEDYSMLLMKTKNDKFSELYNRFFNLKQEFKAQIDNCMRSCIDFRDYSEKREKQILEKEIIRQRNETFYEARDDNDIDENELEQEEKDLNVLKFDIDNNNENVNDYNIQRGLVIKDESSEETSFEECNEEFYEIKSSHKSPFELNLEEINKKEVEEKKCLFGKTLSNLKLDFIDQRYSFEPRTTLPEKIICSTSMLSDMLKSLTKSKITLPITYNEPISMLQRLCEPFQFIHILKDAAKISDKNDITPDDNYPDELIMANIAAFIMAETSLNINRLLKPFNPILGETFEFFDNIHQFRYIAEQTSHHPPISAFCCESEDIVVYGDSRCKNTFKLMKGAMEITFSNKTHIIIKNKSKHFCYNKPTVYLKGLILGKPHYDYSGIITIKNLEDERICCTLDFHEEGRKSKPLGYVEGSITNNKEVKYYLRGNWNYNLELLDLNKNFIKELWKISNEDYITNKDIINNYLMPRYSVNLNYLGPNENLKEIIPKTDSRLRPDQRLVESRDFKLAEIEKQRIEEKQRIRHKYFETNKIIYEANFFSEIFDQDTNEHIYMFKGGYWEQRNNEDFPELYDVFGN